MKAKTLPRAKRPRRELQSVASVAPRTRVWAYAAAQHCAFLKKDDAFDVDIVAVENLNRTVYLEAKLHPDNTHVGVYGSGAFGPAIEHCIFLIDRGLDESAKAALSGLVMSDAPLVVGPRAAGEFTWWLKAEANSRGRIFEVAETASALKKLFASSLEAARRRIVRQLPESPDPSGSSDSQPDVVGSLPGIIEATHPLRSERGRLDAERIRDLFTLSRADLARITGVQEETIRQTPDSERLQPFLRPLERAARLLILNPDRSKFASWLNTPNPELDERTPLDLIKEGRIEVIASLVQDIITNRGR